MNKKKIESVLNNFLQIQGYTEVKAKYDEYSESYYFFNGIIVFGGLTNRKADKVFLQFCKELGLKTNTSIETLTFLHELGHHNTLCYLDEEEIYESENLKLQLYMMNEESDEAFIQYFTCPEEKEATIDAVEFCNHNPYIVSKLDKKLLQALYE